MNRGGGAPAFMGRGGGGGRGRMTSMQVAIQKPTCEQNLIPQMATNCDCVLFSFYTYLAHFRPKH